MAKYIHMYGASSKQLTFYAHRTGMGVTGPMTCSCCFVYVHTYVCMYVCMYV